MYVFVYVHDVRVSVCVCSYLSWHVWKSEDNFMEWFLSFYFDIGSRGGAPVIKFIQWAPFFCWNILPVLCLHFLTCEMLTELQVKHYLPKWMFSFHSVTYIGKFLCALLSLWEHGYWEGGGGLSPSLRSKQVCLKVFSKTPCPRMWQGKRTKVKTLCPSEQWEDSFQRKLVLFLPRWRMFAMGAKSWKFSCGSL